MKRRVRRPQTSTSAGHAHLIPGWLLVGYAVCILGLLGGVTIVGWQAITTNQRLTAVESYVAGKGEQRDRENAELNDRIDKAVCLALDQFPASPRLDPVRRAYGCGPGLPPGQPPATPTP